MSRNMYLSAKNAVVLGTLLRCVAGRNRQDHLLSSGWSCMSYNVYEMFLVVDVVLCRLHSAYKVFNCISSGRKFKPAL